MVQLPFRRKSSGSDSLPTEIKEYYQTERRERVGVAWLLALGTLVLTLVLATGLFFGGRWAYRKIAGNDKPVNTAQTQTRDESTADEGKTEGQSNESTATDGQTGTSSATTSTPSPTPTPAASTPTSAPATTATQPGALPNTGPSEVLGLAAAVTVAGTAAHSAVWSRRNRQ